MEEASGHRASLQLRISEWLLAIALVVAPLALGTVQMWSLSILVVLALVAAGAAALARPRRPPWPVWMAVAVTGFVGLQMVPLPPALLRLISPHAADLVSFTLGDPGWRPLSLDPPSTAREFARLLAFTAALFTASRLATDNSSAHRLLRVIGAATILECLIVVAHKTVDTRRIYGLVPVTLEHSTVLGTFGNLNHLAAYLGLGVPVAAALALRAERVSMIWVWWTTAFVGSAIAAFSMSRAGIAGILVGIAVLWRLSRPTSLSARARGLLAAAAVALVAGGTALSVALHGHGSKLAVLLSPTRFVQEEKVGVWMDTPALIRDYWVGGVGRGAFESVFPSYKHHADWMTFSHIECAPLQVLADLGVMMGVALLVAWAVALWQVVRRTNTVPRIGAVAALAAISVHELADFSLDSAGAVGLTVATLWGVVLPPGGIVKTRSRRPAIAATTLAAAAAGLALWLAWRGDLRRDVALVDAEARAQGPGVERLAGDAIRRHPAEPWFYFIAGTDLVHRQQPARSLRYLNRALTLDPTAWRTHQVLGAAMWQLGRRSQALLEYRLAYISSEYRDGVLAALFAYPDLRLEEALGTLAADDPEVLGHLMAFLEGLRRNDDAAFVARRLVELRPRDREAHLLLARVALAKGRPQEVLEHAAAVGDAGSLLLRVQALDQLHREPEADALLAAVPGVPDAPTAFALAERTLVRKRPDEALHILAAIRSTGLSPGDLARLHALRGRALEKKGKVREAILELVDAARIEPSEYNRLEVGAAYERAGHVRAALIAYRELSRSTPSGSPEARARLARLETQMGPSGPILHGDGSGPVDNSEGFRGKSAAGGEELEPGEPGEPGE